MTTSTKDDNCMISTDLIQQEENASEIINTFRPVLGQFINENLDVAMEALIDAWNKRPKKSQVTKVSTNTTVSNKKWIHKSIADVRRNLKAFDEDYLNSLQDKGGPLPGDEIISRLTKLIFDESNKAEG
jgi:hypothetical protein